VDSWPILEYSQSVLDPYMTGAVKKVESVQWRAARYTLNRYSRTSSVSSMLSQLKWQPLAERRRHARLVMFYKIHYQLVSIHIPLSSEFHLQPTRTENIFTNNIPSSSCDYHLHSTVILSTNCSGLEYATTGSRSTGHCQSFPTCPSYRLKTAGVLPAPLV